MYLGVIRNSLAGAVLGWALMQHCVSWQQECEGPTWLCDKEGR